MAGLKQPQVVTNQAVELGASRVQDNFVWIHSELDGWGRNGAHQTLGYLTPEQYEQA